MISAKTFNKGGHSEKSKSGWITLCLEFIKKRLKMHTKSVPESAH